MISLASLPNLAAVPRGIAPTGVGTGASLPFALPDLAATGPGITVAAVPPVVAIAGGGDRQADAADGQILPDDLLALLPSTAPTPVVQAALSPAIGDAAVPAPGTVMPATIPALYPDQSGMQPAASMIATDPRFSTPVTIATQPLPLAASPPPATVPAAPDAAPAKAAAIMLVAALQPLDGSPAEEPVTTMPVKTATVAAEQPLPRPASRPLRRDMADRLLRRERAAGERGAADGDTPPVPAPALSSDPVDPAVIASVAAAGPSVSSDLPLPADPLATPDRVIAAATPPPAEPRSPVVTASRRTVVASAPVVATAPAPAAAMPAAADVPAAAAPPSAPDQAASLIAVPVDVADPRAAAAPGQVRVRAEPGRAPSMSGGTTSPDLPPATSFTTTRMTAGVTIAPPAANPQPSQPDPTRIAEPAVPWRFATGPVPAAPPASPLDPVVTPAMPIATTIGVPTSIAAIPEQVEERRTGATPMAAPPTAPAPSPAPVLATPTPATAPAAFVSAPAMAAVDEQDRSIGGSITGGSPGTVSLTPPVVAPVAVESGSPVPLDLSQPRWPQAMVDRIEALRDAADANDTRIRLVPDALGAVDIGLVRDGDTIHVRFTAEQAQTRALLQEAQPRLAEAADQRGLKLGQTSVEAAAASHSPAQQQGSQPGQQQPPSTPSGSSGTQAHAAGSQAQSQGQGRQSQPAVPTRPAGAATTATVAQADDDARIA